MHRNPTLVHPVPALLWPPAFVRGTPRTIFAVRRVQSPSGAPSCKLTDSEKALGVGWPPHANTNKAVGAGPATGVPVHWNRVAGAGGPTTPCVGPAAACPERACVTARWEKCGGSLCFAKRESKGRRCDVVGTLLVAEAASFEGTVAVESVAAFLALEPSCDIFGGVSTVDRIVGAQPQ